LVGDDSFGDCPTVRVASKHEGHGRKEKEAREYKEKLEVRYNPYPSRQNVRKRL